MLDFACLPRRQAEWCRAQTTTNGWVLPFSTIAFLVVVSSGKALLTKSMLDDVPGIPVGFSAISCTVTVLWLLPVFAIWPASFSTLHKGMIPALLVACLLVAIDVTCTNISIALLSVPLQQCMSAMTPTITLIIESIYQCQPKAPTVYLLVLVLTGGTAALLLGTFAQEEAPLDQTAVGVIAMLVGLLATSTKYVALHAIIRNYRDELGSLSFLFWTEIFTMVFVVPWSIADGELGTLVATKDIKLQVGLYVTAGLGGVRFLSQVIVLRLFSPTTLSVANVGAHLLAAALSLVVFKSLTWNPLVITGLTVVALSLGFYCYLAVTLGENFGAKRDGRGTCFDRIAICYRHMRAAQKAEDVSALPDPQGQFGEVQEGWDRSGDSGQLVRKRTDEE